MTTSVRLLGTAVALGAGMLMTSLPGQATATAAEKPGQSGESGQGLSICRPLFPSGQITVQCSAGPNGQSADGSSDAVAVDGDESNANADEF